MTLLYLIRHARSTWNAEGRWQGHADPPLDPAGCEQAEALARQLRGEPLAAIYSSPLARARQTAEAVARVQGLPVRLDERLKERHVGAWSGLTEAEVRARYPEQFRPDWWVLGPPGGEGQAALQARTLAAWHEILAAHPEATVAIVSHGGSLNAGLAGLIGLPFGQPVSFRFGNATFARLTVHGERIHLLSLGDAPSAGAPA
ncbi:MAG: histidine phosphatase family protein [Anaerolineales bacterium]|nr:histidine phosphatase family protein [Anaerolineales bacterium]